MADEITRMVMVPRDEFLALLEAWKSAERQMVRDGLSAAIASLQARMTKPELAHHPINDQFGDLG